MTARLSGPVALDSLPNDEIVAESRAVRRQLGAAVGFDLDRMYEQLKAVEAEERRKGREILALATPSGH